MVPSATPSRIPGTPTVAGTPTNTPTPSNTPTITPTATLTPVTYDKNEEPDKPIPDGPGGQVVSELVINDNIVLRQAQVHLTIDHEDAGDLNIWLVHPDGTRIQLHADGQDQGTQDIRRWFVIGGAALDAIDNKSIQGTWKLEITDSFEAKTGSLLSWKFQVYP
jgi:subtilisin-like proprotein convertase family protein